MEAEKTNIDALVHLIDGQISLYSKDKDSFTRFDDWYDVKEAVLNCEGSSELFERTLIQYFNSVNEKYEATLTEYMEENSPAKKSILNNRLAELIPVYKNCKSAKQQFILLQIKTT